MIGRGNIGLEIRKKAREMGVPLTTIEKDYVQNWLLFGISQTKLDMALKGGTGIRKVYFANYRFSEDLDFTLIDEFEYDDIEKNIVRAVRIAKKESGVNFDENIKIEEINNGFELRVYFQFMGNYSQRIKLDITKKENEIILLPLEKRSIIHQYSDNCNAKILSYSLEEIFAEKVRALFQRAWPRDLYDVWRLLRLNTNIYKEVIYKKFEYKNINADISDLLKREIEFKNSWSSSLRNQLNEVPIFDDVFGQVISFLESMFRG